MGFCVYGRWRDECGREICMCVLKSRYKYRLLAKMTMWKFFVWKRERDKVYAHDFELCVW